MMEQNKIIAVTNQAGVQPLVVYIPTPTDWKFMVEWGNQAIRTGMLPTSIKSGEAAAVILLKGRELGLSFMTSISNIHVINGKPSMSAELIQGLARKNLPGLAINIIQSDSKSAKIEFLRPERGSKPFIQEFTWEEAVAAKLTAKDVWKQYPAAMLWSRAITAGLRKVCPEALMGVSYTPEELGAKVDAEGNVIETTGRRIEPEQKQAEEKPAPSPIGPEIINEVKLIRELQAELEISDEFFKKELTRMFRQDTMKGLALDQLKIISATLLQAKKDQGLGEPTPNGEFHQVHGGHVLYNDPQMVK